MRRLLFIFALLGLAGGLVVAAGASKAPPLKASGKVVGVVSGDTIRVRTGTKIRQVRILGVTAPGGCFAAQSKAAARAALLGKTVRLLGERGRTGAYVSVGGRDVGRQLIAAGAAQTDVWGARFARLAAYVPIQQDAEQKAKGMWGACAADVSLVMSGPDQGDVNDPVTYTITASNAGPLTADHLQLELRPAAGAKVVSVDSPQGACAKRDWVANCALDGLRAGATATVTLLVQPSKTGTLSARADAAVLGCINTNCGSAPLQDPNLDNDEAAALTTIVPGGGGSAARICDPSYPTVCIPPPPPDLDCADIAPLREFKVLHDIPNGDPHHLDGNNDGIGCQFDDY